MKGIPNIISVLRIFLSIFLLFIRPLDTLFFVVYLVCGFSDMIDGYIARKMNATSMVGSILDSIGDFVFISVMFMVLSPIIKVPREILIFIVLVVIVRMVSVCVVFYKYKTFAILHTYANKATGIIMFCFPLLYNFIHTSILAGVICTIAAIAAIEELFIHILSKELSRDTSGIFRP